VGDKLIKVLLVEDNPGDARLVREMLTEAKGQRFRVECCDCLSTALQCLADGKPDVILLDLRLPDSDGLETIAKIRAAAEIPVVVLTGYEDEAVAAEAVKVGAQDYLVKGQETSSALARTLLYSIERFRMQNKLERYAWDLLFTKKNLDTIVQKNTDGIVIVDKNGVVRFANPAAKSMLNQKAEQLLGGQFGFPIVSGETTELYIPNSHGQTATIEMCVVEIEWDRESSYLVLLRDVTKRKRSKSSCGSQSQPSVLGHLKRVTHPIMCLVGFGHLSRRKSNRVSNTS